jgi:hypothetical protein
MTAAERLVFLSGLSSGTAAQHLYAIRVSGSTAGQILVSRSSLESATAAEHLLDEGVSPASSASAFVGFIVNMGRMMGR